MSTRRLWAVYLAATVATVIAPLIAEWAHARIEAELGPVDDDDQADDLDDDQADDEDEAGPKFAESDSERNPEHPLAPDWRERLSERAESDSEGLTAPAGG